MDISHLEDSRITTLGGHPQSKAHLGLLSRCGSKLAPIHRDRCSEMAYHH